MLLARVCLAAILVASTMAPAARACTIFVLTDQEQVLFFNNENTSNPQSSIWFIPGGEGHFGAVYVGYGDGSVQGGMNTEGLALDWVAQFDEPWADRPDMPEVRGDYGKRMLEQCATVAEAVAFFKKYHHPTFARTRALIADKRGESVIIGAEDGHEFVDRSHMSRGFGTGFDAARMETMATQPPKPTLENGFRLLRQVRESGATPTRYSNAFNLLTGEIQVMQVEAEQPVTLHLQEELALGPHSYTIKGLHEDPQRKPRPLETNMHRFPADVFPPLEEQRPDLTDKIQHVLKDLRAGTPQQQDFTKEAWVALSPGLASFRSALEKLGDLQAITLVRLDQNNTDSTKCLCRIEFATALVLQQFVLDQDGRIADTNIETVEPRGRE